jgi:hypothetical protein
VTPNADTGTPQTGGIVLWVTCPGSHRFGLIAGRRSGVDVMPDNDYCPACQRVVRCRQDGSVGKHKRRTVQPSGRYDLPPNNGSGAPQ